MKTVNWWLVALSVIVVLAMIYFTVLPIFMHVTRYCVRMTLGTRHVCLAAFTRRGAYRIVHREQTQFPGEIFRVYDNWLGHYDLKGPDWRRDIRRLRRRGEDGRDRAPVTGSTTYRRRQSSPRR